jgi:tetratricopeptide (TPR) repeat protein
VDDAVVVDTGSSDDTIARAAAAGARVSQVEWRDDFSAARNFALSLVGTDWVFSIDADEVFDCQGGDLRAAISDPRAVAARISLQPSAGHTAYRELRLFRADPRIRYRGVIHETVWDSVHALTRDGGAVIDVPGLLLHRRDATSSAARAGRDISLLRAALSADPSNVFCRHELALALVALGDAGLATGEARRAVQLVRERPSVPRGVASLAYKTLVELLTDPEESLELLEEGLARFPENHTLRFMLAQTLAKLGDTERALALFDWLRRLPPDGRVDEAVAHDVRIFDEWAWQQTGMALFQLGRAAEAADAFEHAAAAATAASERRGHLSRAAVARARSTRGAVGEVHCSDADSTPNDPRRVRT